MHGGDLLHVTSRFIVMQPFRLVSPGSKLFSLVKLSCDYHC
jgi:hypothetical protein